MKKIIIAFGLLFLTAATVLAQKQIYDANAVKVDVKGFHAIHVSSAFNVYITQGNEEAVAVSASEISHRDYIKVEVENGVLKIHYDKKRFLNGLGGDKTKLKAYISVKNIDKLTAIGACDVYMEEGIKADELDLNLSGASDLKGKLEVKKLNVIINGASDLDVRGNVSQLNIKASGASVFKGFELVTEICNVTASGASSIQITVNKEISAQASGASNIKYKGEGVTREIKSSGASSISKKS